ncbi:MAG: flagellar type III secretion system pore protein FliP [Cellulomonas sp.]
MSAGSTMGASMTSTPMAAPSPRLLRLLALVGLAFLLGLNSAAPASATPAFRPAAQPVAVAQAVAVAQSVGLTLPAAPAPPVDPAAPATPTAPGADPSVTVDLNGVNGTPSSSITVLLALTVLSVAPSLLLMTTAFTKIFVVLALTRNALGLTGVPPNQVLAGLALFLSLFIMAPVLSEVNTVGLQPYLNGSQTFSQSVEVGQVPLREFMLKQTRQEDLALMTRAADLPNPENKADVATLTLIPAFMLSELRSAFIIGFVIFVPFLVIDLVVSSSLMAMGMMMLPPTMVALPFKLLLFVLVDGWGLIITALVGSYVTAGG